MHFGTSESLTKSLDKVAQLRYLETQECTLFDLAVLGDVSKFREIVSKYQINVFRRVKCPVRAK